jgi:hypothetical protein
MIGELVSIIVDTACLSGVTITVSSLLTAASLLLGFEDGYGLNDLSNGIPTASIRFGVIQVDMPGTHGDSASNVVNITGLNGVPPIIFSSEATVVVLLLGFEGLYGLIHLSNNSILTASIGASGVHSNISWKNGDSAFIVADSTGLLSGVPLLSLA